MLHRAFRTLAPLLLAAAAGCSADDPAGGEAPDDRLQHAVEAYFDELLVLDPVFATFIGEHAHDGRLAIDIAPDHVARRRELEQRYRDTVAAIAATDLDPQGRLTRDLFLYDRETALARLSFPGHLLPVDQLGSLPLVFAQLGSGQSAQPFATVQDYDRFLRRMHDFPAWVDQAIANLREGMRSGVVQPRAVMEAVLPQLDELGRDDVEASVFHQPVAALPGGFAASERERLAAAYREAIAGQVLPAYRRLAAFIRSDYLPATRASVSFGDLPRGADWYAFLVQAMTTTTMRPDEIHALGLAEVARIRAGMDEVRRRVGFAGDLDAFFTHLETTPRFYFGTADELLAGYRALQRRIDAQLPRLFNVPRIANYEVREVESYRARSAPGASYQPPAPDGSRPGLFYINTYNLRAQPVFGMETLSLHEAAPGHHYQQSIQLSLAGLPRFRRFGGDYVAYVEGWALYAESLGPELGLFTDPYQLYGRLSDEMLRAMRLVVDTGLHSRGWTREQAIRYMLDNSSLAETDVEAEVDRYIALPAQALGYKVGELRIRAMRSRAESMLGDRFDVRAFHDVVLGEGALPIALLEARVDAWLAATAGTASYSAPPGADPAATGP